MDQKQAIAGKIHEEITLINQYLSNKSKNSKENEYIKFINQNIQFADNNLRKFASAEASEISSSHNISQVEINKTLAEVQKFETEVQKTVNLANNFENG